MGEQQRWTAKRKAEIILQILRHTTTVVDVARQNDLTPSEVQEWIDTFLKAGEKGLKARASDLQKQTKEEIKELKATIGDLYVKKRHTKKSKSLVGNFRRDRILTLQGERMGDGTRASIRKICDVLGFNRSNVYYTEKPRKKHVETSETWLVDEVCKVIEEFPEYGTRIITAVL